MLNINTSQPPYPNKFVSGNIAISKVNITFCNGEKHTIGQEILVTKETVSYYNVWHHLYDLKNV